MTVQQILDPRDHYSSYGGYDNLITALENVDILVRLVFGSLAG